MQGVAVVLVNCAWSLRVELRLAPMEIYLTEMAYLHAMPSTVHVYIKAFLKKFATNCFPKSKKKS